MLPILRTGRLNQFICTRPYLFNRRIIKSPSIRWNSTEKGSATRGASSASADSSESSPSSPFSSASSSSSPFDSSSKHHHSLPSEEEANRSEAAKWVGDRMDRFQMAMFVAGQKLNDATGYSAIDELKKTIEQQETLVRQYRRNVRKRKEDYISAVKKRSTSQREINQLLQRKHLWSPEDLQRFTDLYRSDHLNENAVEETANLADEAERLLEESQQELVKLISVRYREEQAWSDKIRRASTWGTWSLMGLNVILFLVVQLGLEPWKRKRLVKSFEESSMRSFESLLDKKQGTLGMQSVDNGEIQTAENTPQKSAPESAALAVEPEQPDQQILMPLEEPVLPASTSLSWESLPARLISRADLVELRPAELACLATATTVVGSLVGWLLSSTFR